MTSALAEWFHLLEDAFACTRPWNTSEAFMKSWSMSPGRKREQTNYALQIWGRVFCIYVTPLPFLQYSPFTELCIQLALGVFQILKALILTRPIKIHTLKLDAKFMKLTPSFMVLFMCKYLSCFIFIKPKGIKSVE